MRKLAIFALLSLIAHWAIVSDLTLPVFRQPTEPPPLRVRLQAAPALPPLLPRVSLVYLLAVTASAIVALWRMAHALVAIFASQARCWLL